MHMWPQKELLYLWLCEQRLTFPLEKVLVKPASKHHVTCCSISGYHCLVGWVRTWSSFARVCSDFRLPGWCLWRVGAWCNWIGCYFRLVVLVFACLVGLNLVLLFPKEYFWFENWRSAVRKCWTRSQLCGLSCATGPAALQSWSIDLQQYETTNSDCQTKLHLTPFPCPTCLSAQIPFSFNLYVCLTLGYVFHFFGSIFFHLPVSFHNSF